MSRQATTDRLGLMRTVVSNTIVAFMPASATLLFGPSTSTSGRKYYTCAGCSRICKKYGHIPEAGLRSCSITVVDGRIFGRNPDLAGSNYGHVCQKPNVLALLDEQQKLRDGVTDTEDWLAPYRLPAANDASEDRGLAKFDADGRLKFESRLYAGTTLTFTLTSTVTANGRACYCCAGCSSILKKYWYIVEARLRTRSITVLDGRIVGRDPDLAGSDCGHICQKPDVVAVIEEKLNLKREAAAKRSVQGTSKASSEPSFANWLETYEIPDAHNPQNDFGPAQYDDYGRLEFQSRLHPGATLLFRRTATSANGTHYFYCCKCESILRRRIPLGLRRRNVTVVDGRIVGRNPDIAGSDYGHLCEKPDVIAMIEANLQRESRGQFAIANEILLAAAGDPQLQEGDDDIIFVEEVSGADLQNREQTKSPKSQAGTNDGSSAGRASTSRRSHEPQVEAPPRKRAKTDSTGGRLSHLSSATTGTDNVNVTAAASNAPAVAVTHAAAAAGDPFEGFQPVFGAAVPAGPTSVTFEGVFGSYTFELAKEGNRLVGGAWVPIKSYRCVECFKAMERAGRRQDVPFVLVVNGSFVKRDPEFPMGTNHFCTPGGN